MLVLVLLVLLLVVLANALAAILNAASAQRNKATFLIYTTSMWILTAKLKKIKTLRAATLSRATPCR